MSTVTQIMISSDTNLGTALRRQLDEQHRQLMNIQCVLECLARGTDENNLRGALRLLGDSVGSVKDSILSMSERLGE